MDTNTNALVTALLGAGGATFLWTVVKAYLAIRNDADSREDKAMHRLADWEADCRQQLSREREAGAYWYRVVGIYQHVLERNGIKEPWLPPRPASMGNPTENDPDHRNTTTT